MPLDPILRARLVEQRDLLLATLTALNGGHRAQALLAAVIVRNLVHDTRLSRSLLGQLGVKTTAQWRSFGDLTGVQGGMTLLSFGWNEQGAFVTPKDDPSKTTLVPFDQWWTSPVLGSPDSSIVSRKDIVLALANNDGGGHVDLGNRLINAVRNAAPIFGEEDAEGNLLWQSRGTEQERTIVFAHMATIAVEAGLSVDEILANK